MAAKTGESVEVIRTQLQEMQELRRQFLQEANFQIRYNACHVRNWSDSYLLLLDGKRIGYGSVKGMEKLADRDAVFECYILPAYRNRSGRIFSELLQTSGVTFMESQSNDLFLTSLLFEFCRNIHSDVVLFADHVVTRHSFPEITFRKKQPDDDVFGKKANDAGDYVLVRGGEIVATGGFLTHYNPPFADLYMEVKSECRNQGLGSFILQEIKKECYLAGKVPAARCNMSNKASRATLIKAGFRVCGFMLTGEVRGGIK